MPVAELKASYFFAAPTGESDTSAGVRDLN